MGGKGSGAKAITARCIQCDEERETEFHPGRKSICKRCRRKYDIQRRKNPVRKKQQAKYYREWYKRNGRRRKANYQDIIILWQKSHQNETKVPKIVYRAVRAGILGKPSGCIICGRQTRLSGHHEDYNQPLNIVWLCSSCHKKLHNEDGPVAQLVRALS